MTQNLDLDLISDPTAEGYVALTPANTNITADWTPANSTIAFTGNSVPGWKNSYTAPYSADPGTLFIYSSGSTSDDEQYTTLSECQQHHSDCNMHNHAGNYYNWTAAIASNNSSSITKRYSTVPDSICPAGWRLPKGHASSTYSVANWEFTNLLYTSDITNSTEENPSYTTDGLNNIRISPIYLVRSGGIFNGYIGYGNSGSYWSSTTDSANYIYGLRFDRSSVSPSGSEDRDRGVSVRCVAK